MKNNPSSLPTVMNNARRRERFPRRPFIWHCFMYQLSLSLPIAEREPKYLKKCQMNPTWLRQALFFCQILPGFSLDLSGDTYFPSQQLFLPHVVDITLRLTTSPVSYRPGRSMRVMPDDCY